MKKIEALGAVLIRANDLGEDPAIPESLKEFGRDSYPTNVIYPGSKKALLLPEVLTQEVVKNAFDEAAERLKEK
jgi:thiol:disulfide interchange protein